MRCAVILLLAMLLSACGKHAGEVSAVAAAPAVCADLAKGCSVGGVKVQTDAQPSAMQKFRLLVDAPGAKVVTADLNMLDMDMGPNRYRMLPQGKQFVAEVILPMCISGRSEWLLTLEVDGKPLKLQFATIGKPRRPH